MRLKRASGDDEEEDVHQMGVGMADLALTIKAVADQARGAGTAQSINPADPRTMGRRLKYGQVIPWYIIDPTGLLIQEQRSNASTRLQLAPESGGSSFLCLSARQTARLLVQCPTIFPAWDWITGVALLFTAFVTPFEVGFLPPSTDANGRWQMDSLWVINRVIDMVFILDMLFQFFTMRKVAVEKAAEVKIEWEMDVYANHPLRMPPQKPASGPPEARPCARVCLLVRARACVAALPPCTIAVPDVCS